MYRSSMTPKIARRIKRLFKLPEKVNDIQEKTSATQLSVNNLVLRLDTIEKMTSYRLELINKDLDDLFFLTDTIRQQIERSALTESAERQLAVSKLQLQTTVRSEK